MPIYSIRSSRNTVVALAAVVAAVTLLPVAVRAQSQASLAGTSGGIVAGGETDGYLRYLQTIGRVPLRSWELRPFSAPEVDELASVAGAHPWQRSWMFRSGAQHHFAMLPIAAAAGFNTGFPWGGNDGPVWAGRGLTTSLQGGVSFAEGPISLVVNPIVFRAENTAFALQPNGTTGTGRFADGAFPLEVDRPQRFGNAPYSRFDWGQSTLRVDLLGVTAGVSTANQYWGPATTYPVILGNNAAGIPHVFLGTERPTDIGIGRVQARLVYGVESQSSFSPVTGPTTFTDAAHPGTKRFMSGLVMTYSPAPIPGLDLGAARFFHQAWRGRVGASELRTPFEGILKSSLAPGPQLPGGNNPDALKNQLVSLFARWVLPHSGFEMYGEYGHEDHNVDLRDVESEPDHSRIAMIGFRKAFVRTDSTLSGLRAEYIDGTASTLGRHRGQDGTYIHTVLTQGHTQDGQLLGADIGAGSPAGAIVAWDSYSPHGRTTWYVERTVENDQPTALTGTLPSSISQYLAATLGYTGYRFGTVADLTYGAAFTEAKRGPALRRQPNVNATIGIVVHLR